MSERRFWSAGGLHCDRATLSSVYSSDFLGHVKRCNSLYHFDCSLSYIDGCIITVRLHDDPALFMQIVSALGSIGCQMVSQLALRPNLPLVVRERELHLAMTRLCQQFFARVEVQPTFEEAP